MAQISCSNISKQIDKWVICGNHGDKTQEREIHDCIIG